MKLTGGTVQVPNSDVLVEQVGQTPANAARTVTKVKDIVEALAQPLSCETPATR